MAVLPTNYLDDILAASMGGKRRFRITHEDGSTEEVTLEDVSEYEQVGSPFGSGDVNKTNQTVNEKLDSADVVDPALATVLGFAADAKLTGDALGELTKNCNSFIKELCYNADTNYEVLENRVAVLDWIASNVTKNQCAIIATVRYANGYYYGYNFHTFNNNSFALEYNMHNKAVNVWYKSQDVDIWGIYNS